MTGQLPQPFGALCKGLTLVSPHSDAGKAETFKEEPGNRAETSSA